MHPVGFEPVVPASERPQADAVDRAATRMCLKDNMVVPKYELHAFQSGNHSRMCKTRSEFLRLASTRM